MECCACSSVAVCLPVWSCDRQDSRMRYYCLLGGSRLCLSELHSMQSFVLHVTPYDCMKKTDQNNGLNVSLCLLCWELNMDFY